MALTVTSPAFADHELIPDKYTCDGANLSPPLRWSGVPPESQAIAVVVEDRDAPSGLFTHWLLYDLPAQTTELAEGIPTQPTDNGGWRQGTNDFGVVGYGGPCPPSGSHRYVFRVMALDAPLGLAPGASRREFFAALGAHVMDEGDLTGRYVRG
jgi:Raf kinase inhibitor-like YbhB/YbcL family protein